MKCRIYFFFVLLISGVFTSLSEIEKPNSQTARLWGVHSFLIAPRTPVAHLLVAGPPGRRASSPPVHYSRDTSAAPRAHGDRLAPRLRFL